MNVKNNKEVINSNVSMLVQWIRTCPNIAMHFNELLTRFEKFHFSNGDANPDINTISIEDANELISLLFVNREKLSSVELDLLASAAKSMFSEKHSNEGWSDDAVLYCLFVPLSDEYTVMWESFDKIGTFIMDVFLPSSEPDHVVKIFTDKFTVNEINQHMFDKDWFEEEFGRRLPDDAIYYKECLLLFEYISDIYTNKETRYDFLGKLHHLYQKTYTFDSKFDEIVDRYYKFFSVDTRYMISEIVSILQENDFNEGVYNFLSSWSKRYCRKASPDVVRCFIRDVVGVIRKIDDIDEDDTHLDTLGNNACDMIGSLWGDDDYDYDSIVRSSNNPNDDDTTLASVTEASHNASPKMNNAEKNIYKAYRSYKDAEEKVDSQITKALNGMKRVLTGDVRSEIIEGKKFSAIGLLKQLLGTSALFSFGKIKGVIALVVSYALKKKTTVSERRKIIMELDTEIEMLTEKIEDARGDGNREAKYSMMRTKKELENAKKRIEYGLEADTKSLSNAKKTLDSSRRTK